MTSPSMYALPRQAPPVRPSRSLEGLEKVVPPTLPLAHTRSRLYLDKPLPNLPTRDLLPAELPLMTGSTAWSDDSSTTTVNSFEDHDDEDGHRRQSSVSTESYPVFVRSGSDDLADFVDHPSVSTLDTAPSVDPYDKPGTSSLALTTFLVEEDHYTPPPRWTPTHRVGPNHYFREKKWDFFPELATPSALPQNSPQNSRPRKKDSVRSRWISSDKPAALANDVRNSIRSYVQRRLSRNSLDKEPPKRAHRPTTAPTLYTRVYTPSQQTAPSTSDRSDRRSSTVPQSPLYVGEKLAHLSVSPTGSSISDQSLTPPKPTAFRRKKHLAVPISPYQKYGAAIWGKSGKDKRISYRQSQRVRFPKYRKPAKDGFVSSATLPLTSPSRTHLHEGTRHAVKALQDGTSHVLVAIDGARKKMVGSKVDKKNTQLKSQIRLVGPVNPYTSYGADPWV
ncbi:hypothetical protein BDW59DRAFT_141890 [Aspergillus cavernicola]|uniref:Uncharacterized protein n=1 Tax=Aspergillus cavernicola TaxID=176166 RepID=A0ABR4IQ52_9EURO